MPTPVPPSSSVDRQRRASASRTNTRHQAQRRRQKRKQPPLGQSTPSPLPLFRLLLVWGVLVAASVGIAVKLYDLQVLQASYLLKEARKQQIVSLRSFTSRRPIVDRNSSFLAMDRPVYTLYAYPKIFKAAKKEKEVQANKKKVHDLAKILNRSGEELLKQLNTSNKRFKIDSSLTEETVNSIKQLQLNSLEWERHYSRFYPQHNLVADVVGYVDTESRGQAGVEYSQQKLLERPIRNTQLRQTGNKSIISYYVPKGFAQVDDLRLQLTLDIRLQRTASLALKQQLQKFQAKRGSVIVMDVRDGSILAMAEEPSFDPNEYYKSVGLIRNWALSDLYEPGSTFKPLNVAIALETKAIAPNSMFADPPVIKVGDRQIRNSDPENNTELSVAGILQHSSNVGMVQIIQRMQPAEYYSWLKRLGLGQPIHMDLPFEASSQIKSQKQFVSYPIESAVASFGQGGFSLTPMQLVQLHGALANGGKLVTPHVVRGLFDAQGQSHWQPPRPEGRQIFQRQTAQTVLEMMETVVTQGSGKAAQIAGYRIGGKTGTAQKASSKGGYDQSAKITSFVGILPVESPRYVVLAVVDEPTKGQIIRGSTTAAPIVKSVMDALISMDRLPPSQPRVKASSSN